MSGERFEPTQGGSVTPPERVKCPECGGYRKIVDGHGRQRREIRCPRCNGTGEVPAPPAEPSNLRPGRAGEGAREPIDSASSQKQVHGAAQSGREVAPRLSPPAEQRLYAFTCGCHAVLHRNECPVEERIEVEVVPLSNPADDAELVERVARALCRQAQVSRTPKQRPILFEELGEPGQDFWLAEARAALEQVK